MTPLIVIQHDPRLDAPFRVYLYNNGATKWLSSQRKTLPPGVIAITHGSLANPTKTPQIIYRSRRRDHIALRMEYLHHNSMKSHPALSSTPRLADAFIIAPI